MSALIKTIACLLVAIALAALGLLVPAHVRSVDQSVVELAGQRGTAVETRIQENLDAAYIGPAHRLIDATQTDPAEAARFNTRIQQLSERNPIYALTGGPASFFETFLHQIRRSAEPGDATIPIVSLLLPRNERAILASQLEHSNNANVAALLEVRNIRGLVRLNPADHAAGAPYDAGILTLALLIENGYFQTTMAQSIGRIARAADRAEPGAIGTLEELALATLSLGRQFEYRSLASLAAIADTPRTWTQMAELARAHSQRINSIYTALRFSENPFALNTYLKAHPETAATDLERALTLGPGAVHHLLNTQQAIYRPVSVAASTLRFLEPLRPESFAAWTLNSKAVGILLKLTFLFLAGVAFALAAGAAWRGSLGDDTRPLSKSNPMIIARDILIALVVVVTLWTFIEPDVLRSEEPLSQLESGPRLQFAISDTIESIKSPVKAMQDLNQVTLLVLILFFIVQLVIYVFCLIKLKEVIQHKLSADMKIRLLENEENLFDFGLYVGLGGTVLALILVAVGIVEASLMAAYASTLFGIIFTALFKILHLRPYRRKLILNAGSNSIPTGELMKDIKL